MSVYLITWSSCKWNNILFLLWKTFINCANLFLRGDIAEYCFGLHFGAFTPCIYSFGSDVQVRKWAPLAENLSIIGAYAQTELGHGELLLL